MHGVRCAATLLVCTMLLLKMCVCVACVATAAEAQVAANDSDDDRVSAAIINCTVYT